MEVTTATELIELGRQLGETLVGGEVIELVGDIGAGKTTFAKGLAAGMGVSETVSSPSFVVSNVYSGRDNLKLVHYDFYRLNDPGIMKMELAENLEDPAAVVVVEWADSVANILPADHQTIRINYLPDSDKREVVGINAVEDKS